MKWLIRSAMRALYPAQGDFPGVADTGLDAFVDKLKRESPFIIWLGLVAGALLFTLTPVLTVGIPLPSFWLPRAARDRHAFRVATSRLYLVRESTLLLKMGAGLCWGQDPGVRARFALPPYAPDPGTHRTR